jgi:hypothetical protein
MFSGSMSRRVATVAGAAFTAVLAAGVVSPGIAMADTASTPVGQLTATWDGVCNDFGVDLVVSVSGGFASTSYTAVSVRGIYTPASFVTDAAGRGSGTIYNAEPDQGYSGTVTITVTASGQSGQVPVTVDCPDPKGD